MSRFYEPLSSFVEADCEPLRKRILELVYASIYADECNDVTALLLRAYEEQCSFDERPETEALQGDDAWSYMQEIYVARRKAQGLDADVASEEFDWPEALPRNYPIRKGILKSVARRMAAADDWSRKQLLRAFAAQSAT